MKIGIFGCSFADERSNGGARHGYNLKGRPWAAILREDFNKDITNYSVSPSSMYYSYMNFKENYNKFDKIVFLGTYPGRIYCPELKNKHVIIHLTNGDLAKLTETDNKEQALIKNYYRYFHNSHEAEDMRELMIGAVKQLSGYNLLYIDTPTELAQVTELEELSNIIGPAAMRDHRFCHMSNENNYIFASLVNNWLNGESFEFDINKFIKPSIKELNSYYELT
jgi:hypothetical protein